MDAVEDAPIQLVYENEFMRMEAEEPEALHDIALNDPDKLTALKIDY